MATLISQVLTPGDLAAFIREQPGVRVLDVRTPGEYGASHIPGAYNVPLDTLGEHAREIGAGVAQPVVLVCQSGQRARKAEATLANAGMSNLYVLEGGMNAWAAAGHPTLHGRKRFSLERQVRIAAGLLAAAGGALALAVDPLFALIPTLVGSGLVFAGLTDTCGMATLLAKLPYNRPPTCDVGAMVRALTKGDAQAR